MAHTFDHIRVVPQAQRRNLEELENSVGAQLMDVQPSSEETKSIGHVRLYSQLVQGMRRTPVSRVAKRRVFLIGRLMRSACGRMNEKTMAVVPKHFWSSR
jgi:hypothetical protein